MGNNNSSYNNGHVSSKSRHYPHDYHHHRGHGKWGASQSDLGDSSGNRMKKGYLPTRGYHGQPRPSPHKVLPSVNPTSAAKLLKPTSNGAILHQGGTISGRKLLSELDPHSPEAEDLRRAMRKRSTASCPGNGDILNPASGRSTPNLSVTDYTNGVMMERNGPRRASSKGGSSSRDYDSEPDLRDMDENVHHNYHREDSSPQRSISPVPNSFTLIQESPAKKQIRTKKKGKAPPPPISPGEQFLHHRIGGGDMSCCSPHSPQLLDGKKGSRLFKTKAESRLAAAAIGPRSPEMCSDLEMSRGGVMRASMDANRFFRGDRDRSSVHAGLCTSKSSVDHGNMHLSNRKHFEGGGGVRKASLGSNTAMLSGRQAALNATSGLSSRNNPEVKNLPPLARDHASASSSSALGKITTSGVTNNSSSSSSTNNQSANRPTTSGTSNSNHSGGGGSNIISLINQSGITTTKDEHVPKSHRVSPTNVLQPIAPYGPTSNNGNGKNPTSNIVSGNPGKPSVNQKVSNKGFISSSSSHTKSTVTQQQRIKDPSTGDSKTMVSNGKVGGGGNSNSTANNNAHHCRRKATNAPAAPTSAATTNTKVNSKPDSNNKTMFYFGMNAQPPPNNGSSSSNSNIKHSHQSATATVHQQSDSDNNNNECRMTKTKVENNEKIHDRNSLLVNGTSHHNSNHNHSHHEKVSSTNSSELLQIKQDSGSFDTSEREIIATRNAGNNDGLPLQSRESSSELSSSDLDIPLNIRPTLPAKKLGLPRFSPTAAWRALDSPSRVSVSGRSYSSEEGYGHDRIQRYMRQIPPSRANNHERSAGDSGISAGDAGSPANPELVADAPLPVPPSSNPPPPVMSNGNGGGRSYKLRDRNGPPSGKLNKNNHHGGVRDTEGNKCWTPEQDLDESSSSEYEDEQMSPSHHQLSHHNAGSNVATRVMPAGLGTPPKLTTRNNLFERGRNSALGMVSDSDQYHSDKPGNMYVRSRKTVNGGGGGGQQSHDDMKQNLAGADGVVGNGGGSGSGGGGASRYYRNIRSQPWRQANHMRHANGNPSNHNSGNGSREFVGLDTNWFLSRSEPNSLNLIGNGEHNNIEQQELRLVLAEQDDDDDEVEEELFLPDEDNHKNHRQNMVMMNMHGGGGGTGANNVVVNNEYDEVDGSGAARLESEIGYGPSGIASFSSPLPSPSAVKLNRNKVNRRSNEQQQLVRTTMLSEEFERDQVEMASPNDGGTSNVRYGDSSWERRPFSHIMYLPAYDSRRASSSGGTRRTKSVDNLNFSEMTVYQPRKTSHLKNPISPNSEANNRQQRRSRSPSDPTGRGRRMVNKRVESDEPFERSQSVPPFTAEEENERRRLIQLEPQNNKVQQQHEREQALEREREREQKKKKFKFQSTLRVMERKKIEEQLSREAEEKERRRLQEQEQMRKVEEEFQRKRVREKVMEMEAAAAAAAAAANKGMANKSGHNMEKIEMSNRYDVNFEPRTHVSGNEREKQLQRGGGGNSARSSNISYSTTISNNNAHHQLMYQRQEPEGAPASASGMGDLRKELISASRNRNAFPGAVKQSELTQELSEFCTPSGKRQYFDYRRAHEGDGYNLRSSGPLTRYYNSSSSSDIFPVTSRRDRKRGGSSVISSSKSSVGYLRPTVHPQVVCDIPVKRLPYVVNFSRLSSSNMDLLTEHDRPRSGLGNASILSDNYRKDWVNHHNSRGSGGPLRASSVISLHSAPPLSNSEHFRHSSVDLTMGGSVLHTPPLSPRQSKYSTSPSASPVSHSRPSPEERFISNHPNGDAATARLRPPGVTQEMWNGDCVTGNKTVVMLNSSSALHCDINPTSYQPAAPAPYNRQKTFRPVDFNPNAGGSASGGLSPAHAFHHASAKLTSPTPVS